jgi:hypothetical protein
MKRENDYFKNQKIHFYDNIPSISVIEFLFINKNQNI